MKPLLLTLALATAAVSTARAEYYRPSVVRDTTIVGAVAGALIGGHNGDRWVEGGLIGAAAGAIVGTIADQPRRVERRTQVIQPVAVVPCAPTVVTTPPPQVVYVESRPATRVVYVERAAPVVIARPVVYVGARYGHHHHHRDHRHHGHAHRR